MPDLSPVEERPFRAASGNNKKWGFSPGFPIPPMPAMSRFRRSSRGGADIYGLSGFTGNQSVKDVSERSVNDVVELYTFMSAVIRFKNHRALARAGFVSGHGFQPSRTRLQKSISKRNKCQGTASAVPYHASLPLSS
jgi:hypothetical protein